MFFVVMNISYAAIEQYKILPNPSYGESIEFCLDISGKVVPKVYASIEYPSGNARKYEFKYVNFGDDIKAGVEGYCFNTLSGYEFMFEGFQPKEVGVHNIEFFVDDGIKPYSQRTTFEVLKEEIQITEVDVCKKVETVDSVSKINRPKIDVYGTEYDVGQRGKIFLHLLDGDDQPINDSTCHTSIYYPTNTVWKYQQLMEYVSEGLYVYDFDTPYTDGVYPVTALCTLPQINLSGHKAQDDFNSGSISGGTGWNNNWVLDGCYYESGNVYEGAYSIECSNDRDPSRTIIANTSFTSLDYSFYWRADSLEAGETVYYIIKDSSNTEYTLKTVTDGDDDGTFNHETGTLDATTDSFDFGGTITFTISTSNNLESVDYYNLDLLEINLNTPTVINESKYEIIRGTGEIHISGDKNYEATLMLGELTNETFTDSFTFHYNIISKTNQNKTGQKIELPLWYPFPCEGIKEVTQQHSNGTIQNISYTSSTDDFGRCVVNIESYLNIRDDYDIRIITENQWRETVYEDHATIMLEEEMINISCQNYRVSNNLTEYAVNYETFSNGEDNLWRSCASYLSIAQKYRETANSFFNLDNQKTNFTLEQMQLLEGTWLYMIRLKDKTNSYANTIFNGLNLGNSYSLALISDPLPPPNPLYTTYFANISSSYLNYVSINSLPTNVWNHHTRNLTYIPSPNVNTTEIAIDVWAQDNRTLSNYTIIADEVWGYTSNVSNSNIVSTIVEQVWKYVARYIHGEII